MSKSGSLRKFFAEFIDWKLAGVVSFRAVEQARENEAISGGQNFMAETYEELMRYEPPLEREADFEAFWENGMRQLAAAEQNASGDEASAGSIFSWQETEYTYPLPQVRVREVILTAWDGAPLRGWYLCPAGANPGEPVPGLIRWHGYSSNRGKLCELLPWALMGYAILALDVRGQTGDSPDPHREKTGSFSGWLTRGLDAPENYYYRRVYLDAVQAAVALARRPETDGKRLAFFGNSQGAAISVAAAALLNHFGGLCGWSVHVSALGLGTPFFSHISLALAEQKGGPLDEFSAYFRMRDPLHRTEKHVRRVLSYFDVMNLAPWADCPALIGIGLQDAVCPPRAGFALVNHLGGRREVCVYPDYGHESIDPHLDRLILFMAEHMLAPNRQFP
ncbi:MAG: acetylxylan esterase [Gracilibacteraceae bacterium]|jgi:cephalosporin-C deacetylase|nr:acetylxylan esterase [Gracilibacteraceae bacterium]